MTIINLSRLSSDQLADLAGIIRMLNKGAHHQYNATYEILAGLRAITLGDLADKIEPANSLFVIQCFRIATDS